MKTLLKNVTYSLALASTILLVGGGVPRGSR
jgi:hypothetical protein